MTSGEEIANEARRWIGTPYRHQASALGVGTDCLGLIRGVWRAKIGPEPEIIPPYTPDWAEPSGREVLLDAALRWFRPSDQKDHTIGDLIVFRMRASGIAKHLAIAAFCDAAPTFVHAYTGHGVCETSLSASWQRKIVARYQFPFGD